MASIQQDQGSGWGIFEFGPEERRGEKQVHIVPMAERDKHHMDFCCQCSPRCELQTGGVMIVHQPGSIVEIEEAHDAD